MEAKQLKLIFTTLDDIRHVDSDGNEYWEARELYPLLGYARWEGFESVLKKAKEAMRNGGSSPENHFRDVTKKVTIGSGAKLDKSDVILTRYGCYMTAMNGDIKKQEIAVAQAYFVTQTRKFELIQKRIEEIERLDARQKLTITEKEFGALAFARGVDRAGMAKIKSRGDEELFGKRTTAQMKVKLGVPNDKPLADVLPTVTLKAKDLATAMTTENARQKNLYGTNPIGREHVRNNQGVREALTNSGIFPENLPAAENIKHVEAKHRREIKELEKQRESLLKRQKKEMAQATLELSLPTEDPRPSERRELKPRTKK